MRYGRRMRQGHLRVGTHPVTVRVVGGVRLVLKSCGYLPYLNVIIEESGEPAYLRLHGWSFGWGLEAVRGNKPWDGLRFRMYRESDLPRAWYVVEPVD